ALCHYTICEGSVGSEHHLMSAPRGGQARLHPGRQQAPIELQYLIDLDNRIAEAELRDAVRDLARSDARAGRWAPRRCRGAWRQKIPFLAPKRCGAESFA